MKELRTPDSSSPGRAASDAVYKILRLFTVVQSGEAPTMLLLTLNIFLLMTAYYIIKPVREALIIAGKGAEVKSYLNAGIAVLLIFVVKIFSGISSRLPRQKLIGGVTGFFILNLVIFYFLSLSGISLGTMGIIFFIWVGIFNVMVVAQFWGFANDLYSEEAGKRLFPLIAFGATFGGFTGSRIAAWLVRPLGLYQMMLVSGVILGVCVVLTYYIHNREAGKSPAPGGHGEKVSNEPLEKGGGFRILFRKQYLVYLAFFVLLLNFVNTNGEYILSHVVENAAEKAVASGTAGAMGTSGFVGQFYAEWMMYFNLLAMVIQLFVVSRVFKRFGVRTALFILPALALGGYFFIAAGASLLLIKWVKIAENGTDYSLMNTTRHALFLITSREEKYKAKAAIDTFFHRAGDVFSAVLVFLGTTYLAFNAERFAAVNVVLVLVWIFVGILIYKQHRRLAEE